MSDWIKVEVSAYETLKTLGAPTKTETTYYVQVPSSWTGVTGQPVVEGIPPAPKHRRRSIAGIVYQRNTLKFKQLNKPRYAAGTLTEAVRTAVKSHMWVEGTGSAVKTRNDIEIAVSVATRTKRLAVSSCISRLIKDGWLVLESNESAATPLQNQQLKKKQPPKSQWIKATDNVKLGLGKAMHGETSLAFKCLTALKEIFDKGDMKKVLPRGTVQNALIVDHGFTKTQSSWLTSELIREGWLRRAGPEQM